MQLEEKHHFRDQLKRARAMALEDAERFQEVIYVVERLGSRLTGKVSNLGRYKERIKGLAEESPLAVEIPRKHPVWHTELGTIYDLVRSARNDSFHEGSFARHVTDNAVYMAIVLEDALMSSAKSVSDFMVREPICASPWQPLSFIRQQMLKNSFTYLPARLRNGHEEPWWLVSDLNLASFLQEGDRKERLAMTLEAAVPQGFVLERAKTCEASMSVVDALRTSHGLPLLVVDKDRIVGIVAPFDLL